MKSYTSSLATFLLASKTLAKADCYQITLNGGAVLRWTDCDVAINLSGITYIPGPPIEDGGVKSKRGIQVDTLDLTLFDALGTTLVAGLALVTFARQGGFDGATIQVTRTAAADWNSALQGSYVRFSGRISGVSDITRTRLTLNCSSWMELLNVSMPRNVYQSGCINDLYGAACTLAKATYQASGTVGSGTNGTTTFSSNLATTANYYALGFVVFQTGPNAGLQRTIKSQDASGNLTLVTPLPSAPAAGNTFLAYPGCDKTQSTCSTKFANLSHYRGFPYVPAPETAL
jgi:uncharacterized phage protein (TIGR02218 family)